MRSPRNKELERARRMTPLKMIYRRPYKNNLTFKLEFNEGTGGPYGRVSNRF